MVFIAELTNFVVDNLLSMAKKQKFNDRLKEARLKKGLSQAQLAEKVSAYVSNISRYERGEHKPTTETLTKLANALDVSTDFLMNGSIDDIAQDAISDKELLTQFKKVERLSNDKKAIFKEVIDALLIKSELQEKFAHV